MTTVATASPLPAVALPRAAVRSVTYHREKDLDLTLTIVLDIFGASRSDILQGFFSSGFYSDPPVLLKMMCSREEHHYTGGPGSTFDIEDFRPQAVRLIASLGTRFHLEWVGDEVHGQMRGAFWACRWIARFEACDDLPGRGVVMTETFAIKGFPQPQGLENRPLRRAFKAFVVLVNRIPLARSLCKRGASRLCALFHLKSAQYHRTLPPRIARFASPRT